MPQSLPIKEHPIANSVVVFDEVQTFPVHLLEPIRDVLENLASDYGVTAVFCTATRTRIGRSAENRSLIPVRQLRGLPAAPGN